MFRGISIYYNPTAGSGSATKVWQQVRCAMDTQGIRYKLLDQNHVENAAKDIIVIGGDGTFNTLLNNLEHPEKHRFILLPAGTSNSLCSQISPKQKPLDKLEQYLTKPDFQAIDLPQITSNGTTYRFINEASVGFAASIAKEIEERSTKKHFNRLNLNELAYIATAFRCWRKEEPIMLSFCNNRRISGNLFPCPNAQLNDGWIDVYDLRCSKIRLPYELTRLINAKKETLSPYINRKRVQTASWDFDKPLPVEIDGNPIGATDGITLSLYPYAIHVL